jgi:hypothetical protein
MSTRTLTDAKFRVIGYIETRSDGMRIAKDVHFRIVGYYDTERDQSKDAQFRVTGHGDMLSSLIPSARP